jgi:hypothetical protein
MGSINGKPNLFFITSPRSPYKMKGEILVLVNNFSHQCWSGNIPLQKQFYEKLSESDFFSGSTNGDLALKARDRITRGPKALGLVDLKPEILLTRAGEGYIKGEFPAEAFTRQLLKFQLPSPFHTDKGKKFSVRPYLELIRLIYELDGLSKDEIAAFVMQLTNIDKYQLIKQKIIDFRQEINDLDKTHTNYKRAFDNIYTREIEYTYSDLMQEGETGTRQSNDDSKEHFIKTKKANHKDYADAAIRYLRETKLFSIKSSRSRKITIDNKKVEEILFILESVPREPIFVNDENKYKEYLYSSELPKLLTDDKDSLTNYILGNSKFYSVLDLRKKSIYDLKVIKQSITDENLTKLIQDQETSLHTYEKYSDIIDVYNEIHSNDLIEPSLFMEWNTWRAFVMLDDGRIRGNFGLDDEGMPLSHAPGNKADIVCEYKDFDLTVEVTLSTGATQFEMEGETVPRHLGNHKKNSNKDCFSVFIAPKIHPATIAHFYSLYRTSISFYGGISKIIPLNLSDFLRMISVAKKVPQKPTSVHIEKFIKTAAAMALDSENENDWFNSVRNLIETWV